MPDLAIALEDVSRVFQTGSAQVWAIKDVTMTVASTDAVAVTGPSGSGKTTLLNLMAGLEHPTAGSVIVLGNPLHRMSERQLTRFRADSVGIVFQEPHLLPGLTALENVVLARIPWSPARRLAEEARELLAAVGLADRAEFPPAKLAAGEKQRVAIARALLGKPELLLADEPTGNLDARTTDGILMLLESLHSQLSFTFVVATHDSAVAAVASRVVQLVGGSVESDRRVREPLGLELHSLE